MFDDDDTAFPTIRIKADSEEEFEFKREALTGKVLEMANEQRARLNAQGKGDWWADVVFLIRDIRGICQLLRARDELQIAELLAEITSKSLVGLLTKAFDGDQAKAEEAARATVAEGEILDAVVEKLNEELVVQ